MKVLNIRRNASKEKNFKRMKTSQRLGEHICKVLSDKGLVSKRHKEFLKFNNKKTNNLVSIWVKDLNRHFIRKRSPDGK